MNPRKPDKTQHFSAEDSAAANLLGSPLIHERPKRELALVFDRFRGRDRAALEIMLLPALALGFGARLLQVRVELAARLRPALERGRGLGVVGEVADLGPEQLELA